MYLEHITRFTAQLQNYIAVIVKLLKDVFRTAPSLMSRVLIFSLIGTSLQAFALGATLLILKHLDEGQYVSIGGSPPLTGVAVHAIPLFAVVFGLLGVAVLMLYRAEKAGFEVVKIYVDSIGASILGYFPLIAHRLGSPTVNPKTGLPLALVPKIRKLNRLEIGLRMLVRIPVALLQISYGLIFLLHLEPLLTVVLFVAVTPLLVPLRRFTQAVKEAEKNQHPDAETQRSGMENLVTSLGRQASLPAHADKRNQEIFDASILSSPSYYRCKRLSSHAASSAVGGAAMVVTGVVCILYFWRFYTLDKDTIALVVTYFGALRMAVTSGRQVVNRVSGFAMSYEQAMMLFNDRERVADGEKVAFPSLRLSLSGPDMVKGNGSVNMDGRGFFAVLGSFPLCPVNRHVVTTIFPPASHRKMTALIARMIVLPGDPDLDLDSDWRNFLCADLADSREGIEKRLGDLCYFLDPKTISLHFDRPLQEVRPENGWSSRERMEALLLRASFSGMLIIVFSEAAAETLGHDAVSHWQQKLADRLLLIYYQYIGQQIGRWGETYAALVDFEGKASRGMAPVEWVNANPKKLLDAMKNGADGVLDASLVDINGDGGDDED